MIRSPNQELAIGRSTLHPILRYRSLISWCLCTCGLALSAHAQQLSGESVDNPIYLADAPIASESLERVISLLDQSNYDEATRVVDRVIRDSGDRLIESSTLDVSVPIRNHVHRLVLEHPELLKSYRTQITPIAQSWLNDGDWNRVWKHAWLTRPGAAASLRKAQVLIENAYFPAATRVLNDLQHHPDADQIADQAFALSVMSARYINIQAAWDAARDWSTRANLPMPADLQPISHPSLIETTPRYSLPWKASQQITKPNLTDIVPGMLGQSPLTPESQLDQIQHPDQPRISGANRKPTTWVFPVASDNLLFTNDGITVTCFDRFTMRPIWRLQTADQISDMPVTRDARNRIGRVIEDSTSLTLIGNDLYIPTGIPQSGVRVGSAELMKVDALSGRVQWSVDISTLDPSLKDAFIRGQAVVDQDTIIICARTNNRKQRLTRLAFVGLDTQTGSIRWIRQAASAGSLSFLITKKIAHSPALDQGIVYWTDQIGFGCAIETATGEVVWAKILPPSDLHDRFSRPPYANNSPVITPQGMFTLSADRTQILLLNPQTGETIASRAANPVGEAMYLLKAGDQIACVSKFNINYYSLNHFTNTAVTRSPSLGDDTGIRGRVLVIGDQLLVPIYSGALLLDPKKPGTTVPITLDSTGNFLVFDGQIIVIDDLNASSFLAWKTASGLLAGRIETDPSAAITLAELAYRAHQSDDILPAITHAISVISSLPITQREDLNTKLFHAMRDMIEPSALKSSPLSSQDQASVFMHIASLAQSHEQTVAHRMALGSWNEKRGLKSDAIRAYQDILDQSSLSNSMWEGTGIAVRGGLEASRRIGKIIDAVGYRPYTPFDQLAIAERTFLDSSPTDSELEDLAQRYPWSTITPSLWLEHSIAQSSTSRISSAINSANKGLSVARSLAQLDVTIDQSIIDQLAEQAITGMIATSRIQEAQTLSVMLSKEYPNITLRHSGEIITSNQIAQRARASVRLPILGKRFLRTAEPSLITGSPVKPAVRLDPTGTVMFSPQLGSIEYGRVDQGAFKVLWARQSLSNESPIIPWQDETRTLILWSQGTDLEQSKSLQAINTTTGETIWSIEQLSKKLVSASTRTPDQSAKSERFINTSVDGQVLIDQLIIVTDGHTIVISDRIGRAIGVDLLSGEHLWSQDLPVNRVYDLDLHADVLGVCGLMYTDQPDQAEHSQINSIVAAIEPRTGEPLGIIDRLGQLPRWVRAGTQGNLFVATEERVIAMNIRDSEIEWILDDGELTNSLAGWIVSDQLIVLDEQSDLWAISTSEGSRSINPLDTGPRFSHRGWLAVHPLPSSMLIASSNGLSLFDYQSNLIANDSIHNTLPMIDLARGLNTCVFIEVPERVEQSSITTLSLLDLQSVQMLDRMDLSVPAVLNRSPISITAITGGLIVGYTEVSVFVRTTDAISDPQTPLTQ